MKRLDIMRRAGRNLRQAKGRTFLTSLAIAVGAFTLTLSLAAGEGARQYAENLLKTNIDPNALFIVKDKSIITTSGSSSSLQEYSGDTITTSNPTGRGATIKVMTNEDVTALQKRSDLSQVVPLYQVSARYVMFEGFDNKYVAPVTYYDASTVSDASEGSLPVLGEQIADTDILLAQEFVDTLGMPASQFIGKKVTLTVAQTTVTPTQDQIKQALLSGGNQAVADLVKPQTKDFVFTVRAVLKKSAMALTSNPRLQVSSNSAREMYDYATEGSDNAGKFIGVTAIAKEEPTAVKSALEKEFGFSVQTAKDAQSLLFTFVNILQGIVIGFAVLALIASVFGIINTQYISVLERTSQIGLMKALGMRGRDIAKLFRYEAAWIGFLGGGLGIGLGLLLGYFANPWITEKLDLGEASLLIFVWWQLVLLVFSLLVVAIVAGWLPSRKAAKLDPIEALRTE